MDTLFHAIECSDQTQLPDSLRTENFKEVKTRVRIIADATKGLLQTQHLFKLLGNEIEGIHSARLSQSLSLLGRLYRYESKRVPKEIMELRDALICRSHLVTVEGVSEICVAKSLLKVFLTKY